MSNESQRTPKWLALFTALTLCQLNADKTQCVPVDKGHPLCMCDSQGKNCDGYLSRSDGDGSRRIL